MDSKLNKPSSLENSFKTSGEEVERVGRGDFMRDLGEQKRGKTSEVERADCESLVGGSNNPILLVRNSHPLGGT